MRSGDNGIRVGFDARWYNQTGVGTYVAGLLNALALLQGGFRLLVYESAGNPVPGLANVERIPVNAGKYSPLAQIAMWRRCREDQLDVFHSPFYPVPLLAPCKVVVTIHDLIPFLFNGDRLKRPLVKAGYRLAAQKARRIICVSNRTASDVRRLLDVRSEKIAVIHLGVSRQWFHLSPQPGELQVLADKYKIRPPYVVVPSAINWQTKNLQTALDALAAAKRQTGIDFQTVIYGSPQGIAALRDRRSLGALQPVQTGMVSSENLGALLRYAHLFLMPSLYEGFGLPVLEAMTCGCPVICSNAGSLPEVAGEGAQTFAPLDREGMAECAVKLLTDANEHTLWHDRALRQAARFSWEQAAQQTAALYYRVAGR